MYYIFYQRRQNSLLALQRCWNFFIFILYTFEATCAMYFYRIFLCFITDTRNCIKYSIFVIIIHQINHICALNRFKFNSNFNVEFAVHVRIKGDECYFIHCFLTIPYHFTQLYIWVCSYLLPYKYFVQLLRLSTYNVLAPSNIESHKAKLSDAME